MKEKSIFTILTGFISWLAIIVFLGLLGLTFLSNISFLGTYRTFIIQSGSMEPAINTGDAIIVKSDHNYLINEVVTFQNAQGRIATHRIVDIEKSQEDQLFITKGDANREEDNDKIKFNQIIGKVVLTIPRLGYIVSFGRSRLGIALLLLIPGGFILVDEVKNIKSNSKAKN